MLTDRACTIDVLLLRLLLTVLLLAVSEESAHPDTPAQVGGSIDGLMATVLDREIAPAVTPGFGSRVVRDSFGTALGRVQLIGQQLGHFTDRDRPQLLVGTAVLPRDSDGELDCQLAVLELSIKGGELVWSRRVSILEGEPWLCATVQGAPSTVDGYDRARLSACVEDDQGEQRQRQADLALAGTVPEVTWQALESEEASECQSGQNVVLVASPAGSIVAARAATPVSTDPNEPIAQSMDGLQQLLAERNAEMHWDSKRHGYVLTTTDDGVIDSTLAYLGARELAYSVESSTQLTADSTTDGEISVSLSQVEKSVFIPLPTSPGAGRTER